MTLATEIDEIEFDAFDMAVPQIPQLPFGSDRAIMRVLGSMADCEAKGVSALVGHVNLSGAVVARHAVAEALAVAVADPGADPRPLRALMARFGWSSSLFMGSEEAASLFESLVTYASGESVCDRSDDGHTGYAAEMCDCERRERARVWAGEIALVHGVALV